VIAKIETLVFNVMCQMILFAVKERKQASIFCPLQYFSVVTSEYVFEYIVALVETWQCSECIYQMFEVAPPYLNTPHSDIELSP
jgi:hypothetical protein